MVQPAHVSVPEMQAVRPQVDEDFLEQRKSASESTPDGSSGNHSDRPPECCPLVGFQQQKVTKQPEMVQNCHHRQALPQVWFLLCLYLLYLQQCDGSRRMSG